jgi:bifunctional DNA-binding transcriptional regulator/antitoxin component of YhaV-PrlF toxin-antitoxin module
MPRAKKSARGFSERQRKFKARSAETAVPERLDLQLSPGGRVVIPAVYRKAMQVNEGDRLMARVVDGELKLITPVMAIRRAQKIVRESIPPDVDLVAHLIEERRWEAAKELEDD